MVKRFGISRGVSPRETFAQVGEIAKKVEELGFEALWFIDHQLGMKDVYAAMNVAAMTTGSIEIGCAVTNLQTRHPTVTANATTALDELSDGRALLGLGAGWVAVHSIGEKPNRIAELRAGIELFRELFSGDEVDFAGAKGRLATARRQIPIYLAVSQPRMLELCGEVCDGAVLMGAADPDFCNWQLEHIYRGLRKAGRKREDILIDLIVTMSIDEDAEQAVQDVRAWATSQAATFAVWKSMPPGWERFRPRIQGRRGGLPLRGAPLSAGRAQGDRERGVRALGDDQRRSGSLPLPAARTLDRRHRSHQLRPALRRPHASAGRARQARDPPAQDGLSGGRDAGAR